MSGRLLQQDVHGRCHAAGRTRVGDDEIVQSIAVDVADGDDVCTLQILIERLSEDRHGRRESRGRCGADMR